MAGRFKLGGVALAVEDHRLVEQAEATGRVVELPTRGLFETAHAARNHDPLADLKEGVVEESVVGGVHSCHFGKSGLSVPMRM